MYWFIFISRPQNVFQGPNPILLLSKRNWKTRSRGEAGGRQERPLSSFPLGHFALSSPAELRLDWLKRGCSQYNPWSITYMYCSRSANNLRPTTREGTTGHIPRPHSHHPCLASGDKNTVEFIKLHSLWLSSNLPPSSAILFNSATLLSTIFWLMANEVSVASQNFRYVGVVKNM